MSAADYRLNLPADPRGRLAAAWLLFGVAALLLSGLFVILIILARTPGVSALFAVEDFFRLALVAHVDLSVLVWFAAVAAMFLVLAARPGDHLVHGVAFGLAVAGVLMICVAPFRPGEAIMSNYVPVLDNAAFLAGLALFGAGILLLALRSLLRPLPSAPVFGPGEAMRFGVQSSAIALVVAAGALAWTLAELPAGLTGTPRFETLFWGSGHIAQVAWTQLMLVAWLWLASASGIRVPLTPRVVVLLLVLGLLPAFISMWGYVGHELGDQQQQKFFTWAMAAGGGLAAGPIGLAVLAGWWHSPVASDAAMRGRRVALGFSIALFGLGGLLGFMIEASNTIIPAHYHGCIVAVTLAFLGLALHLLPQFGFGPVRPRLLVAMPWVYGVGQILHVTGLAVAGGQGVQRKTAGAAQGLEGALQIGGMVVTGVGGLVAVIGGILFLVAVAGSLRRRGTA
ncbi:MAG: cytochrome C oxidase subunit I [Gammaproteobacteria bacterium]|nr:MAG: cytochrome C oxidase subunit I [Gammaproteobacteria bacterium]